MACDTRSVLVVDDVVPNIKLLSAILHSRSYTVYEATNGFDALTLAEEKSPAIILLDVMMPGMDGFEVCRKLKENPKTAESAVIYISAKTSTEDKIRGLELGAVDYIAKPFQKAEVLARVGTHMELQLAKARLKESEDLYSTLVEAAHDGIFLWSPEAGVFFANTAFRSMLGYDGDDSLKPSDFVAPEDLRRFEAILKDTVEAAHDAAHNEISVKIRPLKPKGEKRALDVSCVAVGVEISKTRAALATVRDMTEQLLYERHLLHTQKMEALGLLSAGIAHDFNNVLALVNGYAELALLEAGPSSPLTDKLNNIIAAGRNAVSLTKSLLAFTKSKGMEPECVDLSAEVKRIHSFLAKGFPKTVEFECVVPNSKVLAILDQSMLQQMIVNLCLNARDAMPSGGRLKLSLRSGKLKNPAADAANRQEGDYATITVSDTGAGIPDSIKAKIFDPFFTTKTNGKSSGLGLAIADRIARNHKGWMDFESEVGAGSTFNIHLPLAPAGQKEKEKPATKSYKHKMREELNPVLIIDTDEAELAITKYFLDKEGYKTSVASSMKEALRELGSSKELKTLIVARSALSATHDDLASVREKRPALKTLLVSGACSLPLENIPLLKKPFSVKDLLQTLDRL